MRGAAVLSLALLVAGLPTVVHAPHQAKPKLSEFTAWKRQDAEAWGLKATQWVAKAKELALRVENPTDQTVKDLIAVADVLIEMCRDCARGDAALRVKRFSQTCEGLGLMMSNLAVIIDHGRMSLTVNDQLRTHALRGMEIEKAAVKHRDGLLSWADMVAGKAEW